VIIFLQSARATVAARSLMANGETLVHIGLDPREL
jgi:hypothetical protein